MAEPGNKRSAAVTRNSAEGQAIPADRHLARRRERRGGRQERKPMTAGAPRAARRGRKRRFAAWSCAGITRLALEDR